MQIVKTRWFPVLMTGLFLLCSGCSAVENYKRNRRVNIMSNYMVGDFSNEAQHKKRRAFHDVRVHIRPIWEAEKGEKWLFVEQAHFKNNKEHLYRQRVYRLLPYSDGVKCEVYRVEMMTAFKVTHENLEPFKMINSDSLAEAKGCDLFFKRRKTSGIFVGGTNRKDCENYYNDAAYIKSNVKIHKDKIESADEGIGKNGKQVWGSKSLYIFLRQK